MERYRRWLLLPWIWGADLQENVVPAEQNVRTAIRVVESTASTESLFLWLCQLRRAPYSYDWIDNFGRPSPRTPDQSLTRLEPGQSVMTIFTLTSFVPGQSISLRMNEGWPTRLFGAIRVEYDISEGSGTTTLLRATLHIPRSTGPLGGLRRYLLAWGDLFMMRKQLRHLSTLAEKGTPRTIRPAGN